MLIVRDAQMQSLQQGLLSEYANRLTSRVIERLNDLGMAPKEPSPPSEVPGPEESYPIERMTAADFGAEVAVQVRRALELGILHEDYVVQFVSYRFLLGPGWSTLESVRQILATPQASERDCLMALHQALAAER
jgi:hypothetical protein